MISSGSKRRSISYSCNNNSAHGKSPSNSERCDVSVSDFDWEDDKKETATSWSAQMTASNTNKTRARRVYGSATSSCGLGNGSGRGRAPLARMRAEKVPQTLLQKLHLSSSYKRSSPVSEAEDKLPEVGENYNPIMAHSSFFSEAVQSPLSDEATSSSLSKRKRTTETLDTTATKVSTSTKEFAQSYSSSSSPAFSSHTASASTGFTGLSAAAAAMAASHLHNMVKSTSERPVSYHSNCERGSKMNMHFGSDPGGWNSSSAAYPSMSPNPAIDLRALLLQASYTQKENIPNHNAPSHKTAITEDMLHSEHDMIKSPMDNAIATNPPPLLDVKSKPTLMEHISSSSSSTDDDRVSKRNKALFKSRRTFIAPRFGRSQLNYDCDDTPSDSSPMKDPITSHHDVDDDGNADELLHSEEEVDALQQNFLSMTTPLNSNSTFLQQQILESLPSRPVISYLLQQLHLMVKKQQRGTAASIITSYYNNRLTVVPPNSWNTAKRNELIRFATKTLGFTLRNASAGVEFLQIKTDKAIMIKSLIEAALRERKLRTHQGEEAGNKVIVDQIMSPNPCLKYIPLEISDCSINRTKKKFLGLVPRQRRESVDPTEYLPDIGALKIDSLEVGHSERITGTSQPTNDNIGRLPRLSVEQSLPIQDIMFHMTGDSPEPFYRINTYAKRRSDSKFSCHHQGEIPSFESVLNHEIAPAEKATPLTSFSTGKRSKKLEPKRSFSERLSIEVRRDRVISPLTPFPSIQKNRSTSSSCKQEELVITPMMTRTTQSYFCCSQYPSTVDWGASTKCESSILDVLFLRFEAACARATKDRIQQSSDEKQSSSFVSTNAVPAFLSCTSRSDIQITQNDEDGVEDDDSVVPLLGANHFGFVKEHYEISIVRNQSSPPDAHKRKRDTLAKLRRQSICKAVKEFCPRRLTLRPTAPFLLSKPQAIEDIMKVHDSSSFKVPSFVNETSRKLLVTEVCGKEIGFTCPSFLDVYLPPIFDFLCEKDLLCKASLVCTRWADIAAYSLAKLMLISVGCRTDIIRQGKKEDGTRICGEKLVEEISVHDPHPFYFSRSQFQSTVKSMEKSWAEMIRIFPWACFLAEGAYKKVYRVWNAEVSREEAVSVMDVDLIESMGNKTVIGAELAVSVLLSSLARRNICPNFIITRGMFSCRFEPPSSHWGCTDNKQPLGSTFDPSRCSRKPRQPHLRKAGKFQYIRMELCKYGDLENFIATQPNKEICPNEARQLLFQMAFSLYAASCQFGLKHYDIKLLNFFLQSANVEVRDSETHPFTILRYGVGHYIFDLKMPTARAYIAKLADYGTADLQHDNHGNSVTIGQFTTLENSPPEQLILGDEAVQGFGHDLFGLGLCMLHLFTGDAPYEEILQDVRCPPTLKKKLKQIWLSGKKSSGFCVIKSVILSDVFEDDNDVTQGVPDETLYHTLYRYLVLFGIPKEKYQKKRSGSVWKAIVSCLGEHDDVMNEQTEGSRRKPTDRDIFDRDRKFYSFLHGCDRRISRARENLKNMTGGVDLLLSLVEFNPERRASALDVLNSDFMAPLRIDQTKLDENGDGNILHTFMAFHTPSGRQQLI